MSIDQYSDALIASILFFTFAAIGHAFDQVWEDCSVEGQGFISSASSCSQEAHTHNSRATSSSLGSCPMQYTFVTVTVRFDLSEYLKEIEPLIANFNITNDQQDALRRLGRPRSCTICIRAECLGDDIALRGYMFGVHAWISPDLLAGFPSIQPHYYDWTIIESGSAGDSSDLSETDEFPNSDRLRTAIVTRANSGLLGGAFLFSEQTQDHMKGLFDEVVSENAWRLPFGKIAKMAKSGRLFSQWWNHGSYLLGWFFAWRADAVVIKSPKLETAAFVNREYDVILFVGEPEEVKLLPHMPGSGPVRLLMCTEPYFLLNWFLGEGNDAAMAQTDHPSRGQILWSYFKRNGVCPVVLDSYDLPWVIEQGAYQIVQDSDFDRRFSIRNRTRKLPSNVTHLAPMLLAPQMHRWHLPLYQPWHHLANLEGRLRKVRSHPGIVMIDRRGGVASEVAWLRRELEQRGFSIIFAADFTLRRHGLDVYKQPRAVMRSLFEDHMPELASSRYMVLVNAKPAAGQLIAEAAFFGVLAIASPHKMFARLLLPPELHAKTLAEALLRIDELETQPLRAEMLRTIVRGRAARVVGSSGAPPLREYLDILGSMRTRGMSEISMRSLCTPNRSNMASLIDDRPLSFWRFAAGRACGAGSEQLGRDSTTLSPAECALNCQNSGGRVFTFEEDQRKCRVLNHCKIVVAGTWRTDVYVVRKPGPDEHDNALAKTPLISLL